MALTEKAAPLGTGDHGAGPVPRMRIRWRKRREIEHEENTPILWE